MQLARHWYIGNSFHIEWFYRKILVVLQKLVKSELHFRIKTIIYKRWCLDNCLPAIPSRTIASRQLLPGQLPPRTIASRDNCLPDYCLPDYCLPDNCRPVDSIILWDNCLPDYCLPDNGNPEDPNTVWDNCLTDCSQKPKQILGQFSENSFLENLNISFRVTLQF